MNKHIYITREIPESGLILLKEKGVTFDIGKSKLGPTKKELIKILSKKKYDGVISFLTDKIDKEIFDACPTVKVFSNFSVGYDNVDVVEAKKRGIHVTNAPGTSNTAVAEHTVALMMALTTRLTEGDRFVKSGKYKGWDPKLLVGTDLKGKTIGLLGCGAIATEVAHMLYDGFGMKIIYNDIVPNKTLENDDKAIRKNIDELLSESDIVSIHVPLLPSTYHLINKEKISLMKKTAFLINTARGPIIDEEALVFALKNNLIKGAALDVFEHEPKLTKGLSKLDNVILTPHIASSRDSARSAMSLVAAQNIISVLETGNPINSVIQ